MRTLALLIFGSSITLAADWPQWMGPNRDGVWNEAGILDKFPEGGPKKLWSKEIAGGYTGPAVVGGRVYVMDYVRKAGDDKPDPGKRNKLSGIERVLCFDAKSGQEEWKKEYDTPYDVSYPAGPRCTPTVHDGKVYCLGTMGRLTCHDAATGQELWKCEFTDEKGLKAKVPIWGFAGHPLVYKNLLICLAGGPKAMLVAFDKDSGKVQWEKLETPVPDGPGYCPPSLIEAGGVTQLILWHPQAVVSLDPATGKVHWKEPLKPAYGMSIMMPRKSGDYLFAGGMGSALAVKLEGKSPTAELAWKGKKDTGLYPANVTPIIDDDVMYGADFMGWLRAVKVSTGERLWETTEPTVEADDKATPHGTAFLVRNGDKYFLFNEKGSLIIAKLTPKKYEQLDRANLLSPTTDAFGRSVVWSHPAFADKCIFVRNDKEIACFSLAK